MGASGKLVVIDAVNQQILFVILYMAFYTFVIGVPGTYGC